MKQDQESGGVKGVMRERGAVRGESDDWTEVTIQLFLAAASAAETNFLLNYCALQLYFELDSHLNSPKGNCEKCFLRFTECSDRI